MGTKSMEKCRCTKGERATITQTETPLGQTSLGIRDAANQVDFVLYSLMMTACDQSALYFVARELNLSVRYQKLPKDYQKPNAWLAEISLPPTINASVIVGPPGYPKSSLDKHRHLLAARDSSRSASPAKIISAHFQFHEDQTAVRLRFITD